jgi:hypothetical protein
MDKIELRSAGHRHYVTGEVECVETVGREPGFARREIMGLFRISRGSVYMLGAGHGGNRYM